MNCDFFAFSFYELSQRKTGVGVWAWVGVGVRVSVWLLLLLLHTPTPSPVPTVVVCIVFDVVELIVESSCSTIFSRIDSRLNRDFFPFSFYELSQRETFTFSIDNEIIKKEFFFQNIFIIQI